MAKRLFYLCECGHEWTGGDTAMCSECGNPASAETTRLFLPILFQGWGVKAMLDEQKPETRRLTGLDELNHDPDAVAEVLHYQRRDGAYYAIVERADGEFASVRSPYGGPGDDLYVREAFSAYTNLDWRDKGMWYHELPRRLRTPEVLNCLLYRAGQAAYRVDPDGTWSAEMADDVELRHYPPEWGHDFYKKPPKWKPSIHMPRWCSRLHRRVEALRLERVQDLKYEDAEAEGIHNWHVDDPSESWWDVPGGPDSPARIQTDSPVEAFSHVWDSINAGRKDGACSYEDNPWVWVVRSRTIPRASG